MHLLGQGELSEALVLGSQSPTGELQMELHMTTAAFLVEAQGQDTGTHGVELPLQPEPCPCPAQLQTLQTQFLSVLVICKDSG